MPTLSDYLFDTADLLRDSNFLFNSKAKLTRYINQARDQVAKQTGCLYVAITGQAPFGNSANPGTAIPGAAQPGSPGFQRFTTITGVEKYSFGYAVPFLKANYQGLRNIIDVISVSVCWGGNTPSLNWLPWEDLEAYARSYSVGVTSYPFLWSTLGSGTKASVWLFPIPQITALAGSSGLQAPAGEMEWMATCLPSFLNSDSDYEAIPEPFTDSVKYWAAHLAFLGSQRFGMAAVMKVQFNESLGIDNTASDRGKTDSFYFGSDF